MRTRVQVQLYQLAGEHQDCWTHQFEHFSSFLSDKVQSKIKKDIDCMQIACYTIVGHREDAITIEVEWHEEV